MDLDRCVPSPLTTPGAMVDEPQQGSPGAVESRDVITAVNGTFDCAADFSLVCVGNIDLAGPRKSPSIARHLPLRWQTRP